MIWVATYLAYGYPTSAAISALYQLGTVVGLVVLAGTRRFGVFRTRQLLVLPALLQVSLGGFVASSAMILWAIFTPLAALALQGLLRSIVWFVAFFADLVCSRCSTLAFPKTRRRCRWALWSPSSC